MTDIAARFPSVSKMRKMIFKFVLIVGFALSLMPVAFAQPAECEKQNLSRVGIAAETCGRFLAVAGIAFSLSRVMTFHGIDRPFRTTRLVRGVHCEQRTALATFEGRWKGIDTSNWSVANQVDYRLIGSALARVRWELDINPRWQRDPSFYIDQTLAAPTEALYATSSV